MGALGDIWLPAVAGIGRGVSQGIQDYGNVQRIKQQEEIAPLQKGILQGQFDQITRENEAAKAKEEMLKQPWDYTQDPAFKLAQQSGDISHLKPALDALPKTLRGRAMAQDLIKTEPDFYEPFAKLATARAEMEFNNDPKVKQYTDAVAKGDVETASSLQDYFTVALNKTKTRKEQVVTYGDAIKIKKSLSTFSPEVQKELAPFAATGDLAKYEAAALEVLKRERGNTTEAQLALDATEGGEKGRKAQEAFNKLSNAKKERSKPKLIAQVALNPESGETEVLFDDGSFSGIKPGYKVPTAGDRIVLNTLATKAKTNGYSSQAVTIVNEAAAPFGLELKQVDVPQHRVIPFTDVEVMKSTPEKEWRFVTKAKAPTKATPKAKSTPDYATAQDVKNAYRAGKLSRDAATKILTTKFGNEYE